MRPASVGLGERVLLCAALLWALCLRLGYPEAYPFAFDEARLSALALALARRGQWPATGIISSAGVPNFPAAVWLFAVPYALSTDPLVATMWVALANALVVVAAWRVARDLWGREGGLVAAWLVAGSPYLVFYSRNIWAQDWLPVLASVWGLAAWRSLRGQSLRGAVLAGLTAGLAPQVHYAGIVLWLPSVLVLLRAPKARKGIILGWTASVLLAVPFVPTVARGLQGGTSALAWAFDTHALRHLGELITGWRWDIYLLGPNWQIGTSPAQALAAALVGLILLLAAAAWLRDRGPVQGKETRWLLAVWAAAAPLLWFLPGVPSRVQYHLPSLPAWFVVAGAATRALKGRPRLAVVAAALLVACVQGALFLRAAHVAATTYTPGGISTPLGYLREAAASLRERPDVVVHAAGDDPAVDGDAAIWDVLLWDVPHRVVDGRRVLLVPPGQGTLFYVASWMPALEVAQTLWPTVSQSRLLLPKREGELPFVIVPSPSGPPPGIRLVDQARLANGVQLLDWGLQPRGDQVRLVTVWRVETRGDRLYHQFNHVYVPGQEKPLYVQDGPTSSLAWRPGDLLITWADFPAELPEGAWFGVGMYTYPELERVPRQDAADPLSPIRLEVRSLGTR